MNVRIVPVIKVTNPSSGPTNLVMGTSMVSMLPAAPPAMGLPLLIFTSKGNSRTGCFPIFADCFYIEL
jgi:hypothetical protein